MKTVTEVKRTAFLGGDVEVGMDSSNGVHEIYIRDTGQLVFLKPEQARQVVQALKQLIDIVEEDSGK